MIQTIHVLAAASGLMLAAVGANEMTHGGVAESVGIGHQHMADYGGYHCAEMGEAAWQRHEEHMHEDASQHCSGGHMRAGHGGMMP